MKKIDHKPGSTPEADSGRSLSSKPVWITDGRGYTENPS